MGDLAATGQAAAAHYREAQRLLLPVGAVWTDRVAYDQRMEAFGRIQQKLYAREVQATPASVASEPTAPEVPAPVVEASPTNLTVWDFSPGLVFRVCQSFRDYDRPEI